MSESGAERMAALESVGFLFCSQTRVKLKLSTLKSSSSHVELLELDIGAAARSSKSSSSAPTNQHADKGNILNIFELRANNPPQSCFDSSRALK